MQSAKLINDRRFWPFFWTQFLGALNDNILKNGLVILITFKSLVIFGVDSAKMVALCGGIFILPFFLFSPVAGQIADRFEKSKIIRILKTAEIALMLFAAFCFTAGRWEMLIVLLFFMGTQSAFFGPIKYSILPQLIKQNELVGATALLELGTFSAILIGTIIGGMLVAMEPYGASAISTALIGFAILGFLSSVLINKAEPELKRLKISIEPFSPAIESFGLMRKDRSVLISVIAISWFWFFGAGILSLLPIYTRDILHGNEQLTTLFLALFTIGIGAGSIICEKLSGDKLKTGLVPLGAIGMSIFALGICVLGEPSGTADMVGIIEFLKTPSGIMILADFLLLSISAGLFIVPLYTLIQQRSKTSNRSRIIAGNNILNALFMVVAAIMVTAFFEAKLNIPDMFGIIAVLNAVISLAIFRSLPEFTTSLKKWLTC